MSKIKDTKNKIISQIETIKKINDDVTKKTSFDVFLKDLPSSDKFISNKLSDFNIKKNKENKKDVFSDLLDVIESFVGNNRIIENSNLLSNKEKIKQFVLESIDHSLNKSKNIVMDNVTKSLFAGDGICGTNKSLLTNSVILKPSQFDFMNVLMVDPNSNTGKIVYESDVDKGFVKMNKLLYSSFTSNQEFVIKNNNTPLFDISWDDANQEYTFSNLTGVTNNVETFLKYYYTNIEFADISSVTKNALLMTLQGDGNEPPLFDKSINDLNRLLKKIFSSCGNENVGLNQTPMNMFNENDEDIDDYFDFDSVDGIDLDDENARYKKVLRFKDCDNYEIKSNPQHFEDFIYMSFKKSVNDAISDALLHAAGETYEKSGQSQSFDNFHISLLNSYIKNLPKALISLILSPKYILPLVIVYKSVTNTIQNIKQIMRTFSKMFNQIIRDLYWVFITKFWQLVKVELLVLLNKTAKKILKNKLKKYYVLITSLISILTKILQSNLTNCDSLYKTISLTIDTILGGVGGKFNIPGLLLSFADLKPGYSSDRAFMNIVQKLQNSGIDTNPIYGESNKLLDLIKSIVDGEDDERNSNGYVKSSNKFFTVVTAAGVPVIFPPGIIPISGLNV